MTTEILHSDRRWLYVRLCMLQLAKTSHVIFEAFNLHWRNGYPQFIKLQFLNETSSKDYETTHF